MSVKSVTKSGTTNLLEGQEPKKLSANKAMMAINNLLKMKELQNNMIQNSR